METKTFLTAKGLKLREDECLLIVEKSFESVGLKKEDLHQEFINRLVMLEQRSSFNKDSRMVAKGLGGLMKMVGEKFEKQFSKSLTPHMRQNAVVAGLFHDLGKSGPVEADGEQQIAVIDLYAAENLDDPQEKIKDAAQQVFGHEKANKVVENLEAVGVSKDSTMRQFWDLHANWTHDLLEQYPCLGIDQQAKIIAASHHIDRGINPYNIPEPEIPVEEASKGVFEEYVSLVQVRALIAVDKYEAAFRRFHRSHGEAIEHIKCLLNSRFGKDEIMQTILEDIDMLGREDRMFD